MEIKYHEIGICGLSCVLCPMYQTDGESRCGGCKSKSRMTVGCHFINCAVKKKWIEFCWDCEQSKTCERWKKHREFGKNYDTFKCYQKLEDNISFIQGNGVSEFAALQETREKFLKEMLLQFNEGRSKSYYCVATTVLDIVESREALTGAKNDSAGLDIKGKSKILHSILNEES